MDIDLTNVDPTKPNAGRIYDYLLGGDFNLPVDRAAAQHLSSLTPKLVQAMRLNRSFLFHAIKQLSAAGLDFYIDLATGLPTQGYLHDRLPTTVRIIYNDIDPTTVIHGRQIVQNYPNVQYVQSDIRDIDVVLEAAGDFFGAAHCKVGICMVGVAYFIEDEALIKIFRRLYQWSAPGSLLAFNMFSPDPDDPAMQIAMDAYKRMGVQAYVRTEDETMAIAAPWKVYQELQPLEAFAEDGLQTEGLSKEIHKTIGFGGILYRP
jgi:O-methyltransferase involved in polyketide biosynthesis